MILHGLILEDFMKIKALLPVIAVGFLCACSTPQNVAYDKTLRAPTTNIDIVHEGRQPSKPVKEIGEISVEDFGGEDARAMKKLIKKGEELGGNVLLMQPRKDTGYTFNPFGRSGNKYLWKAIVGVYE